MVAREGNNSPFLSCLGFSDLKKGQKTLHLTLDQVHAIVNADNNSQRQRDLVCMQ